ncbi:MAG: hypothetical protein ACTTH7_05745, partial [Treponema sp.]
KDMIAENQLLAAELERTFGEVYQTCLAVDGIIQHELSLPPQRRDRDRVAAYLTELLAKNASLTGLAALFEPNAFDENDAAFSSKAYIRKMGGLFPMHRKAVIPLVSVR